jgi:ER membrane protein complex subunit 4
MQRALPWRERQADLVTVGSSPTSIRHIPTISLKMATPPPPPPQWVLDLNSTPPSKPKSGTFPDPPGFTSSNTVQTTTKTSKGKAVASPGRKPPSQEQMDTLKLKKAWEVALAPAKQLPMNAIGMYMSGNSLQIFSIMMVFMLFKGPIQALFQIQQTFARFETDGKKEEMIMVKLAFVGCNLLALALGIWKVNGMGLLPYAYGISTFRRGMLTSATGRHDPTGSHGRLRGSHLREHTLCLRSRFDWVISMQSLFYALCPATYR